MRPNCQNVELDKPFSTNPRGPFFVPHITDKKGQILYDKATADTEIVKFEESVDAYMAREVLPHVPDAKAFWEEKADAKKPVIKTGAEIPFTRYFYKYQQPEKSEVLAQRFVELEASVSARIANLFKEA